MNTFSLCGAGKRLAASKDCFLLSRKLCVSARSYKTGNRKNLIIHSKERMSSPENEKTSPQVKPQKEKEKKREVQLS